MKNILIINGPNINLIGNREPDIYGSESFDSYFMKLKIRYTDIRLEARQSNHEGEIIDWIQQYGNIYDGIIINAGGYTHTSVAIRDAISAVNIPVVEIHISNIFAREDFRHRSMLSPVCKGTICGFGLESYRLAIESLL